MALSVGQTVLPFSSFLHAYGTAYQDMGMVVTNPLGGYIEPRTFKDYYNKILQTANIGHYTFHALRHTFCTRALENDMDAKTVSTIAGQYFPILILTLHRVAYLLLKSNE